MNGLIVQSGLYNMSLLLYCYNAE